MTSAPKAFTFVDLFAGIGGFHQGCVQNGGICVAACEMDEGARQMYNENYGILPHPDIRTMKPIKGIDLVCAGFPCQSHSSLGLRKGLRDPRGKLFDNLCAFIHNSEPRLFVLENVKGLTTSSSFPAMIKKLELCGHGYTVEYKVLDSAHFGLPQHRERVYIVGSRMNNYDADLSFMSKLPLKIHTKTIRAIMDREASHDPTLACTIFTHATIFDPPKPTASGFLLRAKMSNFTNRKLFSSDGIIGTIATASPPPLYDESTKQIRHLSKKELMRCQGFPMSFKFPPQASRSFVVHYIGNAVSVNVVSVIIKHLTTTRAQRV